MSGHSHAKTIKHEKNITDQKRGQVFSKMARVISIAVKEAGPNPETNYKLRIAIGLAKEANMPKENVERAMKKGSGEGEEEKLEEVVFEAYGPGGVAVIIEGITDNKNRALGEVKQALNQYGGKLVGEGGVRWMFERKGTITINSKLPAFAEASAGKQTTREDLELAAIEAGARDVYWHDDILDVYTKPEEIEKVKEALEQKGAKVDSYSMDWVPKEEIAVNDQARESCQKLFDALDELENVQDIYSNIKL